MSARATVMSVILTDILPFTETSSSGLRGGVPIRRSGRQPDRGREEPSGHPGLVFLSPHSGSWVAACEFSQTALTKPGLPAESHTANRTHDFPAASNGMEKRLLPNGGRSVAGMI